MTANTMPEITISEPYLVDDNWISFIQISKNHRIRIVIKQQEDKLVPAVDNKIKCQALNIDYIKCHKIILDKIHHKMAVTNSNTSIFSRRLNEILAKRGLGKNKLSRMIGVAPSHMYRLASKDSNPTLSTILMVAEALEISPAELVT